MDFQVIVKIKCHSIIERKNCSQQILKVIVTIKSSQRLKKHALSFFFKEERLFYNSEQVNDLKTACFKHN